MGVKNEDTVKWYETTCRMIVGLLGSILRCMYYEMEKLSISNTCLHESRGNGKLFSFDVKIAGRQTALKSTSKIFLKFIYVTVKGHSILECHTVTVVTPHPSSTQTYTPDRSQSGS